MTITDNANSTRNPAEEESPVNPIWVGKEDEHEACPPR